MPARVRALAFQVGLAALLATGARAQAPVEPIEPIAPAPPGATDPAQTSAREAYARGQALFAEAKYTEAKLAFDQAYALVPNPVVLLGSAECDIRLGNIESAHAQLQRYLSERPDAPDRVQIEQKAAALQATPALLMLTSEPRGASVGLDGTDIGLHTPAAIYVRPGEHEVALAHPGYVSVSERVVARMGARQPLRLSLQPIASPASPPEPAGENEASGGSSAPIWISAILGGAALVTGGVLGVLALQEQQNFEDNPTDETADRGERLALFADVAFGVGVIAGLTAVVLYFAEDEAPVAASSPRAERVAFTPVALSHGAGLRAWGRF
jgi:hypothetical protein